MVTFSMYTSRVSKVTYIDRSLIAKQSKGKNMKKASVMALGITLLLAIIAAPAHAGSVVNGAPCAKSGATLTVKTKGASKVYSCGINPALPQATIKTWTLKGCGTYLAAAAKQQDSINQELPLVAIMAEPDKTTYTTQLKESQSKLDSVVATIKKNYCAAGL
jgi:hypothetical protein